MKAEARSQKEEVRSCEAEGFGRESRVEGRAKRPAEPQAWKERAISARRGRLALPLLVGLLCAWPLLAQAQSYSIDWFSIEGSGGGTSTGGVYSVTGTIGQPNATHSSGGSYALDGGFWSIIAVIQTPGSPTLNLTRSGGNVTVSWDSVVTGFVLEETTSLSAPITWQPSSGVVNNNLTISAPTGAKFYRLRKP